MNNAHRNDAQKQWVRTLLMKNTEIGNYLTYYADADVIGARHAMSCPPRTRDEPKDRVRD